MWVPTTTPFLRTPSLCKVSSRAKFLVYHEILDRPGGGKSVFAAQNIPKGAPVWAFDDVHCERPFYSLRYSSKLRLTKVSSLADNVEEKLSNHLQKGFLNKKLDKFIVLEDGAQYTTHATNPNLRWGEDDETWVSTRIIKNGEEFSFDYRQFGQSCDCAWLEPFLAKLQQSVLDMKTTTKSERK